MRLLEPLYGMKACQGHTMVHLIFFIAMCLIDTNPDEIKKMEKYVYTFIKTTYPDSDIFGKKFGREHTEE